MKPYNQLTPRGKILRLRKLVIKALQNYPIEVAKVRYLITESTTMFRVDAVNGNKYVCRIYSEADSSLAENQVEMFWLAALARDTDLPVIQPVARKDGEYISLVSMEGVPDERRCALYKWIPGVPLEEYISPANYHKLGAIMAGLHNHAQNLQLPQTFRPKRWDKAFYFPGEKAVYNTPEYSSLYTPAQIETLDRAIALIDPFLAAYYRDDAQPFIIHGDLHFWNVHYFRGKLFVLDFEDMIYGFPEMDIAISLYYLRDMESYTALSSAFREGYESIRPYPAFRPNELETLWLARMVNFSNYAATAFDDEESAREYISARCEEIERYMAIIS